MIKKTPVLAGYKKLYSAKTRKKILVLAEYKKTYSAKTQFLIVFKIKEWKN